MLNKKKKEFEYIAFELKEGILYSYLKDVIIDIRIAKSLVKNRLEFQEENKAPIILFGDKLISINREAREYFSKHGGRGVISTAVVTNKLITKSMANFYIKVNKPRVPYKIFSNKADAIKWTKDQMHCYKKDLRINQV